MPEVAGRERPGVGWNINSQHSKLIFALLVRSNRLHLAGMFKDQYFHLRSLRDHINHDLSKAERTELDELERDVDGNAIALRKDQNNLTIKEAFCQSIRIYLQKIMDMLLKLGYLPKKESKTDVGL